VTEDQPERAGRSYDKLSRVYSWMSDDSERRFVRVAVAEMLRPKQGELLLEPGFGTGQVLVALAEIVAPEGTVVGLDVSTGMISQTLRRVDRHGLAERLRLVCGDIARAPLADGCFDGVFMSFTLELFDDDSIRQVLAEVQRVLKPEGRLCVASMSSRGGNAAMERAYAWAHKRMPSFVDCRPIDGPAAIRTAGFRVEEHRAMSMWGLAVDLTLARLSD
jgi:demethylmenaquinone methyltransferase/2-methoxy-6-polyprenyl-1,4-benzoquinol methylase